MGAFYFKNTYFFPLQVKISKEKSMRLVLQMLEDHKKHIRGQALIKSVR